MTDHDEHVRIGDDVARVGHADFGFRLVVVRDQHQVIAERLEPLGGFFDR